MAVFRLLEPLCVCWCAFALVVLLLLNYYNNTKDGSWLSVHGPTPSYSSLSPVLLLLLHNGFKPIMKLDTYFLGFFYSTRFVLRS